MLRSQFGGVSAKKEENNVPYPKLLGQPRVRAAFPEDQMHVTSYDTANPRKPGSKNHEKYEGFKRFMAANPNATVLEIVSKSGFYRNDFMHDVKQNRITLGTSPKATPAAKKEAKGLPPILKKKGKTK